MLTPLTKAIRVPDSLLPPLDKGRVRVGVDFGRIPSKGIADV
jgi:hypothetical protein